MVEPSEQQRQSEPIIAKTVAALKKRRIAGWAAQNSAQAREIIASIIPVDAEVGIGDSSSVRQIQVLEMLKARGQRIFNGFDLSSQETDLQTHFDHGFWPMIEATVCDVFLTGTNALTEDGRLLNVDGTGNRVAGMFWGHPISIVVVGKNKIVSNLEQALDRVKNVIAPEHVRRKGAPSPCTRSGRCHDCERPIRVCAVTTIIEGKPGHTDLHVVVVDEDLGLGWDRAWPPDRIKRIIEHHERFMSLCPMPAYIFEKGNNALLWEMARRKRLSREENLRLAAEVGMPPEGSTFNDG